MIKLSLFILLSILNSQNFPYFDGSVAYNYLDKHFEKLLFDDNQSGSYRFNVTDREDIAHPFILGIEEVEFKTTRFSESYTLDWFGREWVIDFESTEAYGNRNKDWLSWLTLIVGLVIAALGMSFTLITTEFNDQLKREVKFKTTQLASAVRRLKKLDHVKNEFIANMSHEIRTPLNVVLGTLQLLQQSQQQKKEKELIESALSSGKTLLSIINDILDMSKLEAGKLSIEETRFDLHKLITDTVKEQITLAKNKGLSLEAVVANTLVGTWRGDPTRIKQILLNLISNSIKFTDQGKVEIVATQSKHGVVFDIVDTGIGIPKEKLALLFKRFEQADTSTTRRFGGTGLGLAIVEQLVQLMKGDISVESDFNKGSQFTVRLPLEKCDPELQTESPQENKTMPNLNNCKILLAEDNAVNQVVFKAIFAESDAAISIAQNGKEAVDMFGDVKPDIIFMDIQMPIMDGEQACVEIRRKDKTIPVIALTANVLESDVKRYLAKGFTRHLAKPIDLNSLIEVVSSNIIK